MQYNTQTHEDEKLFVFIQTRKFESYGPLKFQDTAMKSTCYNIGCEGVKIESVKTLKALC